jgi:type II restriction/modification system DNA methylase subunit YeeA
LNTNNLKKYAPQARRQFISAVLKRINELGVYSDTQIAESSLNGEIYSIEGRNFDKSVKPQRERLIAKVKNEGFLHLVEQVASTWFNRFCAIRFMELKDGYLDHYYRVLSHPDNPKGYEILDHAQDAAQELGLNKEEIIELKLAGNKDEELFRKLLLAQCHQLHIAMPFLFEALDDETELLLPQNLMRTDSILRGLVDDIPESDWLQVEVIGWLYQFYISEKKDQVMGNVVKSEDIPAATQLFTPDWIVQYLVQNSVARQWLEVNPNSNLIAKLKEFSKDKLVARAQADDKDQQTIDAIEGEEFYIEPADQTDEVNTQLKAHIPESIDPESIKVIDPACGSGHILIEAYNVLRFIYQEEGYVPRKIPQLILENNLFGLDIDDRSAQLTGFALMMMARKDDPRIFTRSVKLNTLAVKESAHLNIGELWKDLDLDNKQSAGNNADLFAMADDTEVIDAPKYKLLKQCKTWFLQADTLGSLIDVPNEYEAQLKELHSKLIDILETGTRVQIKAAKSILPFVHQALILSKRYDSLIANPPYMGSKGMNSELREFAKENYTRSKSDLFSMFMERAFKLLKQNGLNAQVNMQAWMFLSGHEKLRQYILINKTIITLSQFGSNAFSQISGDIVKTCAWVIKNNNLNNYIPVYFRLNEGKEPDKRKRLAFKEHKYCEMPQTAFDELPGNPLAFWLSEGMRQAFSNPTVSNFSISNGQNKTADNDKYVREHWEVDHEKVGMNKKWLLYAKGGAFRKWSGNLESVVDWSEQARKHYRKDARCRIIPEELWFESGITWSRVSSGTNPPGFRVLPAEATFDMVGSSIFIKQQSDLYFAMSALNSKISKDIFEVLNPSVDLQVKDVLNFPLPKDINRNHLEQNTKEILEISDDDWNSQEQSIGYKVNQLVKNSTAVLSNDYTSWIVNSKFLIERVKSLEEDNNDILLNAFDLKGEHTNFVPIEQITLYVNSLYIYSGDDAVSRFQSSTMCDLISFSIGCMMGRYSLDREGLIYASSANDGFEALVTEKAYKSFPADDDGIIPLTDEEWFEDDATLRFRDFVKKLWGDSNLTENLEFVAESLCLHALKAKSGESPMATIRRYFSTQFYKDHLKTYKNRPIYWLFSSGKEKAFECVVYLHRYNEGTLSRMRTQYVTPLLVKQDARIGQLDQKLESASTSETSKLKRAITSIEKKQAELRKFDDKLKHYADMRIALNLDDGVKVNYGKFSDLLADVKKIHGKVVK